MITIDAIIAIPFTLIAVLGMFAAWMFVFEVVRLKGKIIIILISLFLLSIYPFFEKSRDLTFNEGKLQKVLIDCALLPVCVREVKTLVGNEDLLEALDLLQVKYEAISRDLHNKLNQTEYE